MWEVLVRTPRGSNNPRKFSMLLAIFFMALFGYIFATAPTTYAANATWDGSNVVYNGNTYEPLPSGQQRPQGIKDTEPAYRYTDTAPNPDLVYFIYFSSGVANPQTEKEATYIRFTLNPPNRYVNPTPKQTIIVTPVPAAATATPDTEDGLVTDTCTIDGVGWFVCPVMNSIAEGMDLVYKLIRSFLVVQPITTSVDNPIYRIWVYSRDLANIAFIIGFLVIIYSYLVGGGFTGYEIRKILPRLAIAAILINLSYILSAIAVDMSNIAGYGVNQLFENVRDEVLPGSSAGDDAGVNWVSVTTAVLAGGAGTIAGVALLPAAIGGAAGGLWFLLAPFLVGGALLIMVTFFILAARQAIIIVLIAIAPLACAAFILPNTEKLFDRWRSVFFTMLIMFPAFGAVFGASQLAGELIIRTATSIEQIILGLGVMVAPLAVTPLLLKLGGGVLNRFGGIVNNSQRGVFDRYKNFNNERRADFLAKQQKTNAERDANGNLVNKGFMRRAAYRQDYKKYNRQRLRDANTGMAQQMYDADDNGIETVRSKARRGYAKARGTNPADPTYAYGSQEIADLQHRTELQKNFTHGRRDEHWQHELQNTPALRTMLTDTRDFEGKAAVRSEAMKAEDDRTFQTNLDTNAAYANLRDMKINTSVDSGVADIHKQAIEDAGKIALSTTVAADRGLRKAKVQSYEDRKRSETIDNTLLKNAEANWNNISKNDPGVQELRLRETQAVDQANLTEQRYNTLAENIVAQGSAAKGVATGSIQYADSIKQLRQDTVIEAKAQETAKSAQTINLMSALKASQEAMVDPTTGGDPTLLKRAAGIGGASAEARIFAQATKTVVDDAVQEVKDDRYLLSQYTRPQLHNVLFKAKGLRGEKVTTEMQQAAMYELLQKKGNNDDAQVIRDAVKNMGMVVDENTGLFYEPLLDSNGSVVTHHGRAVADTNRPIRDTDEIGRRRDWQQFFIDASNNSPHNQSTLSGTDKSDGEAGTLVSGVRDGFMRDALGGKFGPEKMLKADIDELKILYTDMNDPNGEYSKLGAAEKARVNKTVTESILALQTHPTYKGQIDDRNRGVMNQIVAFADPSYQAGTDSDGKPLFYVADDKSLIKPPATPTGNERTFSAPVSGDRFPRPGSPDDWNISKTW